MVTQLLLYLRYRHRLVRLTRRLERSTWSGDLFVSQVLTRLPEGAPKWAARLPGALVLAAAAVCAVMLTVDSIDPSLLDRVTVDQVRDVVVDAREHRDVVLRALLVYLGLEAATAFVVRHRQASLNRAMDAASVDVERAAELADVWRRGAQNMDFLRALFAAYEPLRAELAARLDLPVEEIREVGSDERAGAWWLRTFPRLTEVVRNPSTPQVLTEIEAADRIEPGLVRHAKKSAHARTRFIAQWQRARVRKDPGCADLPSLTRAELEDRCKGADTGLNYAVRSLRPVPDDEGDNVVVLEVDRALYGQIMRSCDYLIEEAFIAAGLCAQDDRLLLHGRWLLRTVPARRAVMRSGIDALVLEPTTRAVGVGLAAVVFVRNPGGGTTSWYKLRSHHVGTYPAMYHAVPTGMFNSKIRDLREPQNQREHAGRVLLTEFFEEFKNAADLEGFDEDQHWVDKLNEHLGWLLRDPESYNEPANRPLSKKKDSWQRLGDLGKEARLCAPGPFRYPQDAIKVYTTGVAFDLLSLRPEICCVIELPDRVMADFRQNEESDHSLAFPSPGRLPELGDLPVSHQWVRSGYAAMLMAQRAIAEKKLDPAKACTPADFGLKPARPDQPVGTRD